MPRASPFLGTKESHAMDPASFVDLSSIAIVAGGTLVATALRCGLGDCRLAIAALGGIGRKRFDAEAVRARLAAQVRSIQRDGLLRADPEQLGDSELDDVTDMLIGTRSVEALLAAHEGHKLRRQETADRAVRTWAQASELAPVFGLAGTLISLTQLPAEGISRETYMGVISMAVLSTLYGLVLAHFLLAPLARLVERAAGAEERERQTIIDWLAQQVAPALSKGRPVPLREAIPA
jgi:chemotaxis protein MotA